VTSTSLGRTLKLQALCVVPDCVTVKVCPAIVSVPVRLAPLFGAAEKLTDPFPVPTAPELIVSQLAWLEAVHAHPEAALTPTVPVPPEAGTEEPDEESENVQAPAWLITTCWPATVTVVLRAAPLVPATANVAVPSPAEDEPPLTVTQSTLLDAPQAQPSRVVTRTFTVPPDAPMACVSGATA